MTVPHRDPGVPPRAAMINPLHLLRRFWFVPALLVAAGVAGVLWFLNAFHDRGYAPVQPIAYSHKQHAGDLRIDCQYCHFSAATGKHAGVPPMSVCLGCHNHVGGDKPEVQKLLAIAEKGSYEANGVTYAGGVVHWQRVHRLPDHVYFSHQWHVQGGVACQTCHGPVEEMTTLRQYATLNMGWCLECHRRSNYVGGPGLVAGEPATFTTGTADNHATIARQERDPVVTFLRQGQPATAAGVAAAAPRQLDRLRAFIAEKGLKDLPQWRAADLPETHKAFYGESRLMNAQTQCSTCHQ